MLKCWPGTFFNIWTPLPFLGGEVPKGVCVFVEVCDEARRGEGGEKNPESHLKITTVQWRKL